MPEQQTKRYHSTFGQKGAYNDFEKDRAKLAEKGWRVVSAVPTQYNGYLISKQTQLVVVYEKE